MSNFTFNDSFDDLRNWVGTGTVGTAHVRASPTSVHADSLTSRRMFFDADHILVYLFDDLSDFYLSLSLNDREIIRVTADISNYNLVENGVTIVGPARVNGTWHKVDIDIKSNYVVSIDDTPIGTSSGMSKQAFSINLVGGTWDGMIVSKLYLNDYQGGTGTANDLQITNLAVQSDGTLTYNVNPGYLYVDDIEYYSFSNMGIYSFSPDPSGVVVGVSGLPYLPGQPYFVVSNDDITAVSGYVRTPFDRSYNVLWTPDPLLTSFYVPTISGAFDDTLVYETSTTREITVNVPIESTSLVLTDEGGIPATIRSRSSYIDDVKVGGLYQAFAEVLDQYGGPVSDATVSWNVIHSDNNIISAGTSVTNDNGIATISFAVTEDDDFHIYAETVPISTPAWIQVQKSVSQVVITIFQLDNSDVIFDSQEGRSAIGENLWGEPWGSNPGAGTGLSYPDPSTHGQWELSHPNYQRPPINANTGPDEPGGAWSGNDFGNAYPSIVEAIGTVHEFMQHMFVGRDGYWGQKLISGADIRNNVASVTPAQVLNPTDTYEISRDYGVTTGTYNIVNTASGAYDNVYYVFYQAGNAYSGASVNNAGHFYFRGVAVYDQNLDQTHSQVQDIISSSSLQA